jgi:NAD-dependent SIR2 family protein deacetylase
VPLSDEVEELATLIRRGGVCVLSGAGLSTESGIPDYRGVTGRARPATPMTYAEFVGDPAARQRYWARSHAGWRAIGHARPNAGHRAVAELQQAGLVTSIITQNVDGLHQAGGAGGVIELHGALDRVICLSCERLSSRAELEARLVAANPRLPAPRTDPAAIKPDGDADLHPADVEGFAVVNCLDCSRGLLKPDVVFFGETVPAARVAQSYARVSEASLLLVLGSSLTVASGFRFVHRAHRAGIDIVIVNEGQTRGDKYAALKIDEPLGAVLTGVSSAASTLAAVVAADQ